MSERPEVLKVGQSDRNPESGISNWSVESDGDVQIEHAALVDNAEKCIELVWEDLGDMCCLHYETPDYDFDVYQLGRFKVDLEQILDVLCYCGHQLNWTTGTERYLVEFNVDRLADGYPEFPSRTYELEFEFSAPSPMHALLCAMYEMGERELIMKAMALDKARQTNAERNAESGPIDIFQYVLKDEVTVYRASTAKEDKLARDKELVAAWQAGFKEMLNRNETARGTGSPMKTAEVDTDKYAWTFSWSEELYCVENIGDKNSDKSTISSIGDKSGDSHTLEDRKPYREISIKFDNGSTYTGEYRSDYLEGYGTMMGLSDCWQLQATGSSIVKYVGDWKDGMQNGYGILYDSDGNRRYEGEFENDFGWGQGIEYDEDGNKAHEGQFRYTVPYGLGTSYYPNGNKKEEGEWADWAEFISGTKYDKEGNVVATYKDYEKIEE